MSIISWVPTCTRDLIAVPTLDFFVCDATARWKPSGPDATFFCIARRAVRNIS